MRHIDWTDERVELLRKLWNDGLSASQMAAEIGGGVTRNAVIGKVHRLGVAQRAKTPIAARARVAKPQRQQTAVAAPPAHAHEASAVGNVALPLAPRAPALPDARPRKGVVIPMSKRVSLVDLREAMCRWPIGDPRTAEFRFCGAMASGAGPYCGDHARIAYTTPTQAKRAAAEWREKHRKVGARPCR